MRLLKIPTLVLILSTLASSGFAQAAPADRGIKLDGPSSAGAVHGYVQAELLATTEGASPGPTGFASASQLINAPDIDVWAKNTATGLSSAHAATNPQGYFRIGGLAPGSYQICFGGSGFAGGCDAATVAVNNEIRVLDHSVRIRPAAHALYGTVLLADGATPCFWFRPAFDGQAMTAKVSLADGQGNRVAGPVQGNSQGQYVLPTALAGAGFKLQASCDQAGGEAAVTLLAISQRQDVALPNHAPKILSLDFSKGAAGVRRAAPGDVVRATVQAADGDGDTLHYRWTDDSGRALGLPDAPSVDWPLLDGATVNTLHVQVSDGLGGFAAGRRGLRAGAGAILFAGKVFNRQGHAPVAGARVSLNQVVAQTDAAGRFQVSVADADKFLLNVSKPGFALASHIYHTLNTALEIPLDAAQAKALDAAKGGQLSFPPSKCGCAGQKRKGNLLLSFPPNALVDAQGRPYQGVASVEALQYDLTQANPMPGDMGGVYQGKPVRLGSFGAFHVTPRDAQGNPLAMAANKAVAVSVPIDPPQLAVAPAAIPFFSYDENTGLWKEEGALRRAGGQYVGAGAVKHFSAFNADTQFAGSACVKVVLDPSVSLPVTLVAEYLDPQVGQFHHNGTQSSDPVIGIERMPPSQDFKLTVTDGGGKPVAQLWLNSGPELPASFSNSGYDIDGVNFSHCNGPVQVYPAGTLPPATATLNFLTAVPGGSIDDHSADYRAATDANPGGTRDTLEHWKQANGFPAADEAQAIYFNNGDLKLDRDMHCRVKDPATHAAACYVSNFGQPGVDMDAQDFANARAYEANPGGPVKPTATVAMEYDGTTRADGTPGFESVQFWAYDGNGDYLQQAALDNQGPKPLPDICLGCHQGAYDSKSNGGNDKVKFAAFLPFDLDSFLYDDIGDPHSEKPNAAAAQEQFRQLNKIVFDTRPTPAYAQLIKQLWYSDPPGLDQQGGLFEFNRGARDLIPNPFDTHVKLYDEVVKRTCRGCHIARTTEKTQFKDDWTSFAQMDDLPASFSIQGRVCGQAPSISSPPNFSMPHAEVPFKYFWQNHLSSTLASELNLSDKAKRLPVDGCPNR